MLELAAVLALAQTCAPAVPPRTLAAIAHVESRFDPLAIGVNGAGRHPPRVRNAAEAARAARRLLDGGANLDLGLAQINSGNLAWLGLSVEDTFDPCLNLRAAATVLRAGYRPREATPTARRTALRAALSRYNTGDPRRGLRNGYVARVEQAMARLEALAGPPTALTAPTDPRLSATVLPPAAWDIFARAPARILFASADRSY